MNINLTSEGNSIEAVNNFHSSFLRFLLLFHLINQEFRIIFLKWIIFHFYGDELI
jgi:hypothetical protein